MQKHATDGADLIVSSVEEEEGYGDVAAGIEVVDSQKEVGGFLYDLYALSVRTAVSTAFDLSVCEQGFVAVFGCTCIAVWLRVAFAVMGGIFLLRDSCS